MASCLTHLLGQIVHSRANAVALGGDLTQLLIQSDGGVELLQQFGLAAAGQRDPNGLGIMAEQTNIDHRK